MDKKLLNFFYKWHRFEKQNKVDIIDFDLIQQGENNPGSFNSRGEAEKDLLNLINDYNAIPNKNEFISAKLTACKYYLSALQGKNFSFNEYVFNTMGIMPKILPIKVLDYQLKTTADAYKKIGYSYEKSSLEKYEKENQLSQKQIESTFKTFRDDILPKVIKWLGLQVELKYQIKFVDIDTYWMNWISTDENGEILLQYNLNKRHKWFKGSTEYLVFHEICAHALQTLSWKNQIIRGRLYPFVGLTTVFSPEQFSLEGIAESLFYFYPQNPFSDYGLVSLHTDHLYWLVMNNAHIMINSGHSVNKIIQFVKKYLPTRSEEEIAKNLKEKVNDPLFKTYQYIYGIALYYHKQIATRLTEEQRRDFVLDIYQNVYNPETILDKYKVEL
jgi:hypothetical protein